MSRARQGLFGVARALAAAGLLCGAVAWAQNAPSPAAPAPSPPTAAPNASAPTAASTVAEAPRTVAVNASGGPSDLGTRLQAAIAAWQKAAPKLVNLSIAAKASSTVDYAAPALLGPDTLSLDVRRPGQTGVEIRLAGAAAHDHPMVLLHEVGVLLGLPEGKAGVMAYAVPAKDEPAAPTPADVTSLQQQRSFAPEDLNRDGVVDFYDLVLFGQAFGSQGVNLPADFNGDGKVDNRDLAMLERAYTFSPPAKTPPGSSTTPTTSGTQPSGTQPSGTNPSTQAPAPGSSSNGTSNSTSNGTTSGTDGSTPPTNGTSGSGP